MHAELKYMGFPDDKALSIPFRDMRLPTSSLYLGLMAYFLFPLGICGEACGDGAAGEAELSIPFRDMPATPSHHPDTASRTFYSL
ncbi:hypothetical protein ACAM_0789 [Aeropyrum camini SY1 = JCM 12091]|uniref:Uncharacterized protein n=1 Tax=Aeropyrum camini SY1 = JCM 12091 TaxID=1198449 RepID=U3TE69_9CREN|nr:hypothetical protein ACAM_0789 [Aeropyrum camini SY1 = JCM 12091]